MQLAFLKRSLQGAAFLLLPLALFSQALAEDAASHITGVNLDAQGNIILNVDGEGFDPLVRMEKAADGHYRITLTGDNVLIEKSVQEKIQQFSEALASQVPAVDSVNFYQDRKGDGPGVRIVFESLQPLQPQVRGNTGNKITIALVGNRNLPPGSVVQKAVQKPAETVKPAESDPAASKQVIAQQPLVKLDSAKPVQQFGAKSSKPQTGKTDSKKPWAPGYQNFSVDAGLDLTPNTPAKMADNVPGGPVDFQPGKSGPVSPQGFTPKVLSHDALPQGPQRIPVTDDDEDTSPTQPIKLKATPPAYAQASEEPPMTSRVYKAGNDAAAKDTSGDSLYALISDSQTNPAVKQAWQDVQHGDLTGPEMALRNYLEKSPNDSTARYLLARILLKPVAEDTDNSQKSVQDNAARREAARQELLKIVSQAPFLPAYVSLMDMYLDDENYEDANRLWQKVSVKYPNEAMVLYEKGRMNEALNDLAAARESYIQALSRQPDNAEFHYRLAQVELKAGRMDAARWELNQALQLSPDDGRIWKLLGYIAEKQGNTQQAAQFYKEAMHPDVLINYGRLLESQNQPEKALSVYTAVENLAGDDPDILYNLGMIYAQMKQSDRAQASLKHFLEIDKDTQDSRVTKARATLKSLGGKSTSEKVGRTKILPF